MVKIPVKWIKWMKRGLLIMGLGLIAVGLIMSLVYNVILAPCTVEHFTIKTDPELSVFGQQFDIDCALFEPKTDYDVYGNQRPAVVLTHGFMSSKVYFRALAYELTKRGFVCLSITANGHSASGGAFTPTFENITLSGVKFLRDYNASLKIDVNRIGLIGHSMGSFSATVASILDQELGNFWVNVTIGMGGPFLNISEGFGDGFAYMLGNPIIYPNIWYDPVVAIENAVIEGRPNLTRPYNYMNIIGADDQAFSVGSAYELIYGMSTPGFWAGYGVADENDVISSQTYGEFNGSARRLVVVPGVGHGLEGQHEVTVNETIHWLEAAMKLNHPVSFDPDTITAYIATLLPMLAALGGMILIVPLIAYYGSWLKPKMTLPKNAMNMEKKDKWRMFLIYGITFVGVSFLAMLVINGLNLYNVIPTDFLAANLIGLPMLVQGLLMIPVVILLMWYEKRKYNLELSDYGLTKEVKPYLKAGFYGFLLFFTLYVILNLVASAIIHNFFIWRIVGFLELFLYIFVGTLVFEILFRGMIQNKLYKLQDDSSFLTTRVSEVIKAAIITGILEGLALGIIVTGMLAAGGFNVFSLDMGGMIPQDMGISFGWLPPMFILVPMVFIIIEVIFGVLKAGLYREINRNVMASTIFVALILAWLLSVIMPATSLSAPRFVFMT